MSAIRNIRMLTRYSRWANDMVFAAMIQLPCEDVYQKRDAAFGGMIYTLAHINIVEQIWKSHLLGIKHGFESRTTQTPDSLEGLISNLRALGDWYIQYADTISELDLDENVPFNFIGGGEGQMTRGDILIHVCNHKTFHRGHLCDMFYQSGFKPPSIDLPVFMRDAWVEADLNV